MELVALEILPIMFSLLFLLEFNTFPKYWILLTLSFLVPLDINWEVSSNMILLTAGITKYVKTWSNSVGSIHVIWGKIFSQLEGGETLDLFIQVLT